MRTAWNLYKRSQLVRHRWIRQHPVKYIVLNVVLTALLIGFYEWRDRREQKRLPPVQGVDYYTWRLAQPPIERTKEYIY